MYLDVTPGGHFQMSICDKEYLMSNDFVKLKYCFNTEKAEWTPGEPKCVTTN